MTEISTTGQQLDPDACVLQMVRDQTSRGPDGGPWTLSPQVRR